jgi:hypothetical protein
LESKEQRLGGTLRNKQLKGVSSSSTIKLNAVDGKYRLYGIPQSSF